MTLNASSRPGNGVRNPVESVLNAVPVTVDIVLGDLRLPIEELQTLTPGEVLALDRNTGEPIDIHVSGRLMARGRLVLVDGQLGVTLTEIVDASRAA
jgi:flagellar motor switch protein FliN/FliY